MRWWRLFVDAWKSLGVPVQVGLTEAEYVELQQRFWREQREMQERRAAQGALRIVVIGRKRADGVWCVALLQGAETLALLEPNQADVLAQQLVQMVDICRSRRP